MKREYMSPEAEIISFTLQDVLGPSTYVPDPQIPTRAGEDDPIDDL